MCDNFDVINYKGAQDSEWDSVIKMYNTSV